MGKLLSKSTNAQPAKPPFSASSGGKPGTVGTPKTSSSPRTNGVTSADRAILKLKVMRDRLSLYQTQLQDVSDRELRLAQEALAQDRKDKALYCLRKRKERQVALTTSWRQLENTEQMILRMEAAQMDAAVMSAIRDGTEQLKQMQAATGLTAEEVERVMAAAQEAADEQREISELLGQPLSNASDEDECLRELEALERGTRSLPPLAGVAAKPVILATSKVAAGEAATVAGVVEPAPLGSKAGDLAALDAVVVRSGDVEPRPMTVTISARPAAKQEEEDHVDDTIRVAA